jgi:hypothetical protein
MIVRITLLAVASLVAAARPTSAACDRAVVYSLDPEDLYRVAQTASMVIDDGTQTKVADGEWVRRLSARIDALRPSGDHGAPGDIRLVAVVGCKGRKAIQIAVPLFCQWVEVDGARAPFDPALFGLLLKKIKRSRRAEWLAFQGCARNADSQAGAGGE